MKHTFRIVTLGCRSNHADSAVMAGRLMNIGYSPAEYRENADVCIVNTCTVTNKSDSQSRQAIRKIIRENPLAQIFVTGCYAKNIVPEEFYDVNKITIIPIDEISNINNYINIDTVTHVNKSILKSTND